MREDERIRLDDLLRKDDIAQTTNQIRELRHSSRIKIAVDNIVRLKKNHSRVSKDMFRNMAVKQAEFLYTNYTEIFNKIVNDELNIKILYEFITILNEIETGKINQHEGSYLVGKKLKELYVDGVVNKDNKCKEQDAIDDNEKLEKLKKPMKKISYKQFKILQED
jgi:hypothetical protein